MNSYERALATLEGRIPDRVPTFEIMIDPKVIKGLMGYDDYMDFCDYIDMDIVVTSTPSSLYRNMPVDESRGIYRNEWGTVRQYGAEVVPSVLEVPLKDVADIYEYTPPDPYDEYRYTQLKDLLKRFKGKRLVGMHLHDSFNYPYYLRGMEDLFMDMFDDPEAVHHLVDITVDHNIAIAERAIDLGADFILLGDDYGGGDSLLISPNQFKEFFLPGFEKIVDSIKSKGALCIKHCCGNINSILDEMVDAGIDALHPLDPSAGMDIVAVKEKYKDLTVIGGINCYEPLCEYTLDELKAGVKNVMGQAAPGGRYIMASSNSIHSDVKPENFKAMQEYAKKYGKY
ncbi:MAG: hypothetical protein GX352_01270 [Clostridiales bacterium]|nr:hypothetical protein [Clostridiales bacterium]